MADRPAAARRVLARDVRAHLRGFLYWLVPVAALLVLVLWIEPSMAKKGSVLEAKLALLPAALKQVFSLDGLDFKRPAGYLAVNFVYVTLTAPLSAGMLGATLVAKEEALRTAELLLTLPVSRARILAGKIGALAAHVALFHAALLAITLGVMAIRVHGRIEPAMVASLFGGAACLAVCFGGLGMLAATVVRRPRGASNAALALVLGGYLLAIVGAASPDLAFLARISPFHAVAPARVLAAGGLDPVAVAALLGVGVAATVAAVVRYARRDILL